MEGKLLSNRDADRLERMLRWWERHRNDRPPLPRRPLIISDRIDIKIFEVQSAATGDGVYNCREEQLLNAEWDDTAGDAKTTEKDTNNYEILNLEEHDPEAGQHNLSAGDFLAGWQGTDNEGNNRWVGIPLASKTDIRQAWLKDSEYADGHITCHLDEDNSLTEVEVYIDIWGNASKGTVVPPMEDGLPIKVYYDTVSSPAVWRCLQTFIKVGNGLKVSDTLLMIRKDFGLEFDTAQTDGVRDLEVNPCDFFDECGDECP